MFEFDRDSAVLHLGVILALVVFVLFMVLEDLERLHRLTAPRLVWIADDAKEAAPSLEPPLPAEPPRGDSEPAAAG